VARAAGPRLAGKVAIITGASSGIGAAIAKALAHEGCSVVLAARRMDKLMEVAGAIMEDGHRAMAMPTDVRKRADMKTCVEAATQKYGPVDIIVNCAGVMYFTLMKNCHEDEWERTIDVNCKGVLNAVGAVLPGMLERGSGHIVNISSDAARRMFPCLAVYCASKMFVQQIGEGMRRELVGTGVRITDVQPGDVKTNLVMHNTDEEAAKKMGVQIGKKVGEGWATRNTILDPEDVANAVLYAVTAPAHVAVNEILVEPRDQS
jgi:NADP-dependent 3-hydroxy acid dehydrogenase YdfG